MKRENKIKSIVNDLDTVITVHFFFFLNEQFIMQSAKAGYGNYLVATIH